MQIQILNVTASQQPTKTPGKTYSQLEIAFKNLTFDGKIEGKKIMGFGAGKPAYDTLLNALAGQVYGVEVKKSDAGYNDWISAKLDDGSAPAPAATPASAAKPVYGGSTASPKSTYETPEERAKKQVYIVRQSSISNAIDVLSVGAKAAPDVDKVLAVAKEFEKYVFDMQIDVATAFNALEDPTVFDDLPQ